MSRASYFREKFSINVNLAQKPEIPPPHICKSAYLREIKQRPMDAASDYPICSITIFRISSRVSGLGCGSHADATAVFTSVDRRSNDLFAGVVFFSAIIVFSFPPRGDPAR